MIHPVKWPNLTDVSKCTSVTCKQIASSWSETEKCSPSIEYIWGQLQDNLKGQVKFSKFTWIKVSKDTKEYSPHCLLGNKVRVIKKQLQLFWINNTHSCNLMDFYCQKKLTSFKNREKPQTLQRMQYSLSSQEYKEKGTQKKISFFLHKLH